MSRNEFIDEVKLMCQDNFGEELTKEEVLYNWEALLNAYKEQNEIMVECENPTKEEINKILKCSR